MSTEPNLQLHAARMEGRAAYWNGGRPSRIPKRFTPAEQAAWRRGYYEAMGEERKTRAFYRDNPTVPYGF